MGKQINYLAADLRDLAFSKALERLAIDMGYDRSTPSCRSISLFILTRSKNPASVPVLAGIEHIPIAKIHDSPE